MPRAHGGGSLLHFALNHGLASRPADLQRLIDAGCSIDATDAAGETPLLCALLSGLPDAAQALLNLGADPRASTGTGVSALHLACDRGYLDLAKELLARGADARAVDAKGRSCLWYAKASPGKAKEVRESRGSMRGW